MFRYEKLTSEIASKICDGTFEVGEKLPSVRKLSRSLNLSLTTVLEAYHQLEDRGLIISKPKSGFFVQPRTPHYSKDVILEKLELPKEIPFSGLMQDLLAENDRSDIIRLGLAQPEPDLLPQKELHRILRRILRTPGHRTSDYLDPKGLLPLRQKIAALMLDRGVNISASDVVVTNGCQQALRIVFNCVAKEGDIIAVETPCYPGLLHIASELGAKVIEIPARADEGIDLNLLSEALENHDIKAIFLTPTCSNPNGSTIPIEKRKAIAQLAKRHQALIIEDDTNRDLFYLDPPPSLKSFDDNENILYCASFSKTIGPGMRLGWMIPGPYKDLALAKRYTDDLGGPSIEQYVLADFVGTGAYHKTLSRAKLIHAKTAALMVRGIHDHFPKGTEVAIPTGGFLLWVKLPKKVNGQKFRKEALKEKISIAPGSLFSETRGAKNYARIGWGGKWNVAVEEAIATLGKIARGLG